MAIANIQEGMTWGQVFEIINQLIDSYNSTQDAIAASVTNGQIDYNKIINRPSINSVELLGDLMQADLSIEMDVETKQQLSEVTDRVAAAETSDVNNGVRITTLEGYRTTDRALIDELTPYKARVQTLESTQETESGRIDLLDERYSSLHTTQTTEQTKVANIQVQIATDEDNFDEVVSRLKTTIGRVNEVVDATVLLENNGCTVGRQTIAEAHSGTCVSDISNNFSFDE